MSSSRILASRKMLLDIVIGFAYALNAVVLGFLMYVFDSLDSGNSSVVGMPMGVAGKDDSAESCTRQDRACSKVIASLGAFTLPRKQ